MKQPFDKFIRKADSGAQKKERIRQEKKEARRQANEFFEQKKQERRAQKAGLPAPPPPQQETRPERKTAGGPQRPGTTDKRGPARPGRNEGFNKTAPKKTATGKAAPVKKAGTKPAIVKAAATPVKAVPGKTKAAPAAAMPLNKFIAHCGICSRRDAAELVKKGVVMVNGTTIEEPGFKVSEKDEVKVQGKKITIQKNLAYILLNKPKDYITTTEDPQGRKTVLDLLKNTVTDRIYPIGRLDRNTTGVLLLTNDGELAQKLAHPSYQVKKIYEVKLDKPLTKKDFDSILNGITLEDGFIAPDSLAYADSKDKSVIGIEIHSGRNRIVRRIFEHLGYDVRNLDRVMYANLTKKNVERGKWRFLSEKEVRLLKYMNASYAKK